MKSKKPPNPRVNIGAAPARDSDQKGEAIILGEANVLPNTDMEYFGETGERMQELRDGVTGAQKTWHEAEQAKKDAVDEYDVKVKGEWDIIDLNY